MMDIQHLNTQAAVASLSETMRTRLAPFLANNEVTIAEKRRVLGTYLERLNTLYEAAEQAAQADNRRTIWDQIIGRLAQIRGALAIYRTYTNIEVSIIISHIYALQLMRLATPPLQAFGRASRSTLELAVSLADIVNRLNIP
ncbi:hypothetical protein EIP91_005007 [Steccherinum ochraceum]|uniref:Uncharacterized protein n=1 Tax=Steccherinum ochraceum TaxID=92696 RepID=A0A4R0R8C5_9APHY|nr:hypothetical protein EIP91_005007 [Steccherinum ochraceum]